MKIFVKVKDTEDSVKLIEHVKRVIPGLEIKFNREERALEGEGSFEGLWKKIREKGSEEVFGKQLEKNKVGNKTHLYLSKISASNGKLELYGGSAIGKIELEVDWKQAEAV